MALYNLGIWSSCQNGADGCSGKRKVLCENTASHMVQNTAGRPSSLALIASVRQVSLLLIQSNNALRQWLTFCQGFTVRVYILCRVEVFFNAGCVVGWLFYLFFLFSRSSILFLSLFFFFVAFAFSPFVFSPLYYNYKFFGYSLLVCDKVLWAVCQMVLGYNERGWFLEWFFFWLLASKNEMSSKVCVVKQNFSLFLDCLGTYLAIRTVSILHVGELKCYMKRFSLGLS